MTEIVLVRHGETESNRLGLFRGRLDLPLNERGREQAGALARALKPDPVAAVFTSPLVRAVDTASAIAREHGLDPVIDEAFNNIDLGRWQGLEKARVEREEPDLWNLWMTDPERWGVPGAESLSGVRERALRRVLALLPEFADRRFVIVSHRSVLKLLAGALLGMAEGYFWKFYLDNAGYSVLGQQADGFVLLKWNEACHLRERVVERY
jgi:broad specificity phosphatase PhoE